MKNEITIIFLCAIVGFGGYIGVSVSGSLGEQGQLVFIGGVIAMILGAVLCGLTIIHYARVALGR